MGTDDDGCSSLITHRVKRRRTRGERNKIRAGLALSIKDTNVVNLSKKEKSKDKDPVNLEAFVNTINKNSNEDKIKRKQPHREPKLPNTRNLKKEKVAFARNLRREPAMFKMNTYEGTANAITTSRLTKRMGIFNLVKKSDKIHRAPLIIPSEVSTKTKDDLQRVLDLGRSGLSHSADLSTLHKRYSCESDAGGDNQLHVVKSLDISFPSLPRSPVDMVAAMETCITTTRSPKKLPQSPDIVSIAKRISGVIKPAKSFPNRRYFEEKQEELRQLLRESAAMVATASSSGEEDMNHDASPFAASTADINPLQAEVAESSQRRSEQSPSPALGDPAPQHLQQEPQPEYSHEMTAASQEEEYVDPEIPGMTVDALTDAKSFLACTELAMTSREFTNPDKNTLKDFIHPGKDGDSGLHGSHLPASLLHGAGDGKISEMDCHPGKSNSVFNIGNKTEVQMHSSAAVHNYLGCMMPNVTDSLGPGYDPNLDRSGLCYPEESLSQRHHRSCPCPHCAVSLNYDHDYIPAAAFIQQQRMPEAASTSYDKGPCFSQYSCEMDPALALTYQNIDMDHSHYYRIQNTTSMDLLDLLDQDPQAYQQQHLHHPAHHSHHFLTRVSRPPAGLDHRPKVNNQWQHMNMIMVAEKPQALTPESPPRLYPQRLY